MDTSDDLFIDAPIAGVLSRRCAAALRTTSDLVGTLMPALPAETRRALEALIAGRASIGIETLADRNSNCRVRLIAIEQEGQRRVIAEVKADQPTGAH